MPDFEAAKARGEARAGRDLRKGIEDGQKYLDELEVHPERHRYIDTRGNWTRTELPEVGLFKSMLARLRRIYGSPSEG